MDMTESNGPHYAAWTDPDQRVRLTGDAGEFAQALREQPTSTRHLLVHSVRWSIWPYTGLARWADEPPASHKDQGEGEPG